MAIAPYRFGLTATYERADNAHELLEETGLMDPVVYEEEVVREHYSHIKAGELADQMTEAFEEADRQGRFGSRQE